ncbi:MAG: methionine synthase, partial [Solirubrobacterales bacterium]|nr:methionine synthase [Solirubrobacterales bacterium]
EGLSEWLHWKIRDWYGIPETQGRRLSWGYPAVPEQSEHEKVAAILDIGQIGMTLTDGYSPDPEQSTLAMVVHHPQAIYYGMRNGRLLPDGSPDEVIRGTRRDPTLVQADLLDNDPVEGPIEDEAVARPTAQPTS